MCTGTWKCCVFVLTRLLLLEMITALLGGRRGNERRSETDRSSLGSVFTLILPSPMISHQSKNWLTLHVSLLRCIDSYMFYFFFRKRKACLKYSILAIAAALWLWLIQLRECYPACFSKLFCCHIALIYSKRLNHVETMCFVLHCRCKVGSKCKTMQAAHYNPCMIEVCKWSNCNYTQ